MATRLRTSSLAVALVVGLALPVPGATLIDPALRFRVITTPHFVIYFHQNADAHAWRLAQIAEDVWGTVGTALAGAAPRRTHVVLADQSELANGWATPFPYNTIFVTAAAPAGWEFIGRTSDWLRIVFTHEFTHIVHLDRSEGWTKVFRGLFGRTPIAFPNVWLPGWQIEGLASWQESALTGEGRLHAGDFRAVEREAARSGRSEPLDRVNGGLIDWPGGLAPYAAGLGFHDYLAGRFGGARLGELADRTARRAPFFAAGAFEHVFGRSLGDLWKDYAGSIASRPNRPSAPQASTPQRRLTRDGYIVLGPRFLPPRCSDCPIEIVYSHRGPNGFPALHSVLADGSSPRRLATRYLGATVGRSADAIVFDQQQVARNVGFYSDLYALDRRTGHTRRLTNGERIQDPDLSPAGDAIVAVRQRGDRRDLVLVRLHPEAPPDVVTLMSTDMASHNAPRWSPDGRRVVVEQHRFGADPELIAIDVETGHVTTIASFPGSRIVTPTWRPDGRAIVAAADVGGDTFNLYEFNATGEALPPRRLTATTGGAFWPDVSPDGRTIVFAGYTPDGFDVFTMPYPADAPIAQIAVVDRESRDDSVASRPASPYSPWPTLQPTSWTPIVEANTQLRLGFSTNGFDVLGRHAYGASATWLVRAPDDALRPSAAAPDWLVRYAYDRWRPTLFAAASRSTLFSAGSPDASGRPRSATLRSIEIEAGVLLPVRHVRAVHRAMLSFLSGDDRYTTSSGGTSRRRSAFRTGLATNTSQRYGNSISSEDGIRAGATAEYLRRRGGAGGTITLTGDVRAYAHGIGARHVIAVRAAGGLSSGTPSLQRTFVMGGAGADTDVLDFNRDAVSLLRAYPPFAFAGTRAALLNAEYRWPIARPQRGVRTWPIFLQTVYAAVFGDAGHTWTERFNRRDVKTAAGGELSFNIIAGYSYPLTATVGAAWGRDGSSDDANRAIYVRFGRAF